MANASRLQKATAQSPALTSINAVESFVTPLLMDLQKDIECSRPGNLCCNVIPAIECEPQVVCMIVPSGLKVSTLVLRFTGTACSRMSHTSCHLLSYGTGF